MDLHVFPIPPPSPSHPSGSSQCTSPEHLSHASNLGWWSVSPLIVYLISYARWGHRFASGTAPKRCWCCWLCKHHCGTPHHQKHRAANGPDFEAFSFTRLLGFFLLMKINVKTGQEGKLWLLCYLITVIAIEKNATLGKPGLLQSMGLQSHTRLSDWTTTKRIFVWIPRLHSSYLFSYKIPLKPKWLCSKLPHIGVL